MNQIQSTKVCRFEEPQSGERFRQHKDGSVLSLLYDLQHMSDFVTINQALIVALPKFYLPPEYRYTQAITTVLRNSLLTMFHLSPIPPFSTPFIHACQGIIISLAPVCAYLSHTQKISSIFLGGKINNVSMALICFLLLILHSLLNKQINTCCVNNNCTERICHFELNNSPPPPIFFKRHCVYLHQSTLHFCDVSR